MNLIHLLLSTVISVCSYGQIVLDQSIVPTPGDILKLRTVNTPQISGYDVSGIDREWNFSTLPEGIYTETIIMEPSAKALEAFPDATTSVSEEGTTLLFSYMDNQYRRIGISGLNYDGLMLAQDIPVQGAHVIKRTNARYGDKYDDNYSYSAEESVDALPDTIKTILTSLLMDSIRIILSVNETVEYDAYGNLSLPGGTFEVLKSKVNSTVSPSILLKNQYFGWNVLDPNLLGDNAALVSEFLKASTTVRHEFHANNMKEIAAVVTETESTEEENNPPVLQSITYADRKPKTTGIDDLNRFGNNPQIKLYPNPTYGNIELSLINYPEDDYTMIIYNIIGKELMRIPFKEGSNTLVTDVSILNKGTYIYTVKNGEGKKLTTRRLVIMTP